MAKPVHSMIRVFDESVNARMPTMAEATFVLS